MRSPAISIILPNLNHREFLEERVASIIQQTYADWECIIVDGFSRDGSFEYLSNIVQDDKRFKLYQRLAIGPYDAWNYGIEKADGQYIYIATSDDTMTLDFLEKMKDALDNNYECDIAHCNLTIINKDSKELPKNDWSKWEKNIYFGEWLYKKHIRIAPHDGILHAVFQTVYTSITEIVIRKSLFDKIGLFRTDKGNIADYEWGMRATLVSNIVHIPEFLASWRIHDRQLTLNNNFWTRPKHYADLCELIRIAVMKVNKIIYRPFDVYKLQTIYQEKRFIAEWKETRGKCRKVFLATKWMFLRPDIFKRFLKFRKKKLQWPHTFTRLHDFLSPYELEKKIKIYDK